MIEHGENAYEKEKVPSARWEIRGPRESAQCWLAPSPKFPVRDLQDWKSAIPMIMPWRYLG